MCAHDILDPLLLPEQEISCNELSLSDQRSCIFHLLYTMEAFDYTMSLEAIADNLSRFGYLITPQDNVFKQAAAIVDHRNDLDTQIIPLLDKWRFERLGMCTRLIMRLAVWELLNTTTQSSIIINEAIELAKCFAETDAYKFINGVLDEWIKKYRKVE